MKTLFLLILTLSFIFTGYAYDYSYTGTFTNFSTGKGGTITLEMSIMPNDSVYGYANFTGRPGEPALCAAGDFGGRLINGDSISIVFTSYDPDPGCGFDHGVNVYIYARFDALCNALSGTYAGYTPSGTVGSLQLENTGSTSPCPTVSLNIPLHRETRLSLAGNPCTLCELKGEPDFRNLSITDISGRGIPTTWLPSANGLRFFFAAAPGLYCIVNRKTGKVLKFIKE